MSELLDITPNYLNAVENGKNFPSPEVLQRMIDVLEIMPYQLFVEYPDRGEPANPGERGVLFQEISCLKQKFNEEFDRVLQKHEHRALVVKPKLYDI